MIIDGVTLRPFGGEAADPNLVGRRKKGTKHTLMVNKAGVPLAARGARASENDHTQVLPIVVPGSPRVGGKPGRPEGLPDEVYADRGSDSEATRAFLGWLGSGPHSARRRAEHGSGLGEVRWVVERATNWLEGLRRPRVRCGRLGVILDAWTTLVTGAICYRMLHHGVFV